MLFNGWPINRALTVHSNHALKAQIQVQNELAPDAGNKKCLSIAATGTPRMLQCEAKFK